MKLRQKKNKETQSSDHSFSPESKTSAVVNEMPFIGKENEETQFHQTQPEVLPNPAVVVNQSILEDINNNPEKQLTKQGKERKRKLFTTTVSQRKKIKMEEKREKFNIKPPCKNCKRKCPDHTPELRRKSINNDFWLLDWMSQRRFILANTECVNVKRKQEGSSRNNTFLYFLPDENGKKVSVCKTFFLTTLGFKPGNDKMLHNALSNERTGLNIKSDQRGKLISLSYIQTLLTSLSIIYFRSSSITKKDRSRYHPGTY